jgi:hypothetical protein
MLAPCIVGILTVVNGEGNVLQYPSIEGWRTAEIGKPCIAFYKYDGSNLRWEYEPKRGWKKMGTRRQLFDETTPLFNQAIELFHDQMAGVIVDTVNHAFGRKVERITAFTEFYGPSSFAGSHGEDEQKTLTLFDVFVFKKGFIPPKQFVKLFSPYDWSAKVVYEGVMDQQFIHDVYNGNYPVEEGVICKGADWSTKIKTRAYLDKLMLVNRGLWEEEKNE